MGFISEIRSIDIVIRDEQGLRQLNAGPRGRIARDWSRQPFGSVAQAFDFPLIPRNEWQARIEEMEKTRSRLSDLILQAGNPNKNQGNTNYCWVNAVVRAMEIVRLMNGLPYVALSPASVGGPIKNYRNQGGWGGEALDYIIEHGVANCDTWPANAIDRQYDNEASRANRLLHTFKEWTDVASRDFDQKMTLLFNRIPVPCGYNHMGHEMCSVDPVYLGGDDFGARDENSWGDTQRWIVFGEEKATPDDAVAPRVPTASLI